jgi:hypothetical protein
MAISDLAAGGVEHTPYTPEQLFAGDAPIVTGQSVALADLDKYQVVVLTPTGLSETFDFVGDMDPALVLPTQGANCVITAQAGLTGAAVPYFSSGYFNHAMLSWPSALDTLVKRKAFFAGTPIQIGEVKN